MADFLDDYQPLPPPGGYVTRLPGPPCGDCGAAVFEVVRSTRRVTNKDDGTTMEREAIDVQCPRCRLLTSEGVTSRRVIGKFHTVTGRLVLVGQSASTHTIDTNRGTS